MSPKKARQGSGRYSKKYRKHRKDQGRLEHRKRSREDSGNSTPKSCRAGFSNKQGDAKKGEPHNKKITQKCSTAKSVEEFVNRLNKIGDKLNTHHIFPQSRIGADWEITEDKFITNEWNELLVLEREHVCLNVLFEVVVKIKGASRTISRTPQEICKQIEIWGDVSGKINFGKLNAIQIAAWSELFGRIDSVKDAIDLIKNEWDIQSKWQNICKEISMLKVRKFKQDWFVRNHEIKLAVATVSARYRKEIERKNTNKG